MAGRYVYGEHPDDIFRRHDNCGCKTIYESGRTRQDVWTKKSWEAPDVAKDTPKPTKLTFEQGKALEKANLRRYHGLTADSKGGIIEVIRKSVEIPESCKHLLKADTNFEGKNISKKVLKAINDTIDSRLSEIADFEFSEIKVAKFSKADAKSVFITNLEERGYIKKSLLYLNRDFFVDVEKSDIDKLCEAYYDSGWWFSKSLEDLVNHEIMHARINYHNSYEKVDQLYQFLKEDKRIKGFCGLVDKYPDEFLNEMYVAINNGIKVENKYLDVYNEYIRDYLEGE